MATEKSSVNRALWLSSFTEPPKIVDLPIPEATAGTGIVQILAVPVVPYNKKVHLGELPLLRESLPLVPNPNAVGRIYTVESDATSFKPEDLVYADSTVQARDNDTIKIMAVAGGAILEAANVSIGEIAVVGPCAGSFGGLAVELALAIGGDVIGVGRFKKELKNMKDILDNAQFAYVVMTGDQEVDTAAILGATKNELGADIVSDWSPGCLPEPPYLSTMVGTLKNDGRVVLS
ncbi:hypothetical protein FSARC_14780 [Fusarium sarcochroum]|uniref:Alcohol dehydrogenase-like C-terminal domain-containing protein n=1 Tax=Fusarium sarcochroum TaxID=1208366 RepID=A0A8H4SQY1_9HYPO|nr:hypothetical protein FSARC_14780 [Fusarium sarcochroum]